MIFPQKKSSLVKIILAMSFFISCKSRNMNEGDSRSSSKIHAFEICGTPISMKMNSEKMKLLSLRTNWQTAVKISEVSGAQRDSTPRLVEVTFRTDLPASLKLEAWNSQKYMCVQAEFIQKRIVAHSFSIRDSVLEEQEITACGKIFEEEGLFGVHVANERERRPVVLVGRNTKKTRLIFHSLVGDFACVRGRPFLAQKNLALLTDSASIARASPHEVKLHVDSHDPYSRDPEIRGKSRAKEFIDTYRNRTKEDQIEILTDHILFLDSCAEKNKWDLIKDEVDPDPKTGSILTDFDPEWAERYGKSLDVEMIECCDTLNALIGETKDRGFFQKIFRKGANPSNMYMDRKNDFSELRQGESYNGDEDLELDML